MRTFAILGVMAVGILTLSTESQAGRHDRRQGRQGARIGQGVKNGSLTRSEARGLHRQQQHVERLENKAEADGTVTGKEAARIENAQDRASRNIYRQKHDEQKR